MLLSTAFWALVTGYVLLAICVVVEQIAAIERYTLKARWRGITFATISTPLSILMLWPLQQLWKSVDGGRLIIPLLDWLSPLGWSGMVLYYIALLLVGDFFAYWRHRFEHTKLFWPIHAVHHSPTELHGANNWGHPLQLIPQLLFVTFPLSFLQFTGPAIPAALGLLVAFLVLYIHSPIDFHFGPLRRVIVDNRFHRIHHSVEECHLERNFGILFSVWDWIFRTAYWPRPGEWPAVGIDRPPPNSIRQFLLYPVGFVRGGRRRVGAHQWLGTHRPS